MKPTSRLSPDRPSLYGRGGHDRYGRIGRVGIASNGEARGARYYELPDHYHPLR